MQRLKTIISANRSAVCGLLLALCVIATPSVAPACDADSILGLMEQRVQSHVTIRLQYTKEAHSVLFGERPSESGTLWLGPPRRYRIETGSQVYVRGFDTLWTYSEAAGQVTVRVGDLDSLEFGPAGFFGSLQNDFIPVDCMIDSISPTEQWRVRLVAKTETAAIQRLTLWISTKTKLPYAAEYVDYNEETSYLAFSDYRSDQAKDRHQFTFDPPADAEVVVLPTKKTARKPDSGR